MAATYEPIATTTLGSAASSITFSSIPNTYTDLRVVLTGTGSVATTCGVVFNSDTATNYSSTYVLGDGASATSAARTNTAYLIFGYSATLSTTIPSLITCDIFSYAGSTYKTVLMNWSNDLNGSGYTVEGVGLWRSTSAINTILLKPNSGNFNSGTTATIYGIKAA